MMTIEDNVKAFNSSLKVIETTINNVVLQIPVEMIKKQRLQFDDVETLPYVMNKEGTIILAGQNLQQRFENGELGDLQKQISTLKTSISAEVMNAIKEKLV